MGKNIRLAVFGYGNRVKKYLTYLDSGRNNVELTGIVDTDPERLLEARENYPGSAVAFYSSPEDFFGQPAGPSGGKDRKPADAVIIGTPDNTHYSLCMEALRHGCHVLLEKPAAQTVEQCRDIMNLAAEKHLHVVLCYVLRYHPLYSTLKKILDSGRCGEIISINHIVNVGIDRTCHTFVRGPWSDSKNANPMILSKCCHDIDLILWLTGKKAEAVSSFGELSWFRRENAPEGSGERCLNCAIESNCPFSAIDLYVRRREWTRNFIVPKGGSLAEVIDSEMRSGAYGRCVYRCGNDVVDHQTVAMKLGNGPVVSLAMNCFTRDDDRITDIKCVFGEISVRDNTIRVRDFRTGEMLCEDFSDVAELPLHAGADLEIVEEFLASVAGCVNEEVLPSIESSIESHRICFMAEKSRITGLTVNEI